MICKETSLPGVMEIKPDVYSDERGYFFESYSRRILDEKIGRIDFVQDNESFSVYGVLRGLHYQTAPYEQAKLVRAVSGRMLDIAVDIRKESPSYGHYVGVELSGQDKNMLFIPRGYAHGFAVLSETAVVQYKCDNFYAPDYERGIRFDDPYLNIDWRIPADRLILSDKDRKHPFFNDRKQ